MQQKLTKYIQAFSAFLPFLFIIVIGQALKVSHGFIKSSQLIYITCMVLLMCIFNLDGKIKIFKAPATTHKLMSLIWILFSIFLIFDHELFYAKKNISLMLLNITLWFNLILSILYCSSLFIKKFQINRNIQLIIFLAGIFTLLLGYTLTISASPEPIIDVHSISTIGSDYFFKGLNPYEQVYPDILKSRYGYNAGYVYWPLVLLSHGISRYLLGDVRYIYILCHLLTVIFIMLIGKKLNHHERFYFPLSLIWLSFPVSLFVLEQTWTEPLVIVMFLISSWFLLVKKPLVSAVFIGLLCGVKQYNIFFAIIFIAFIFKNHTLFKTLVSGIIIGSVFLLIMAPFHLWNPDAFVQKTIYEMLAYEIRIDALSWVAWLKRFYNFTPSGIFYMAVYGTTTAMAILWIFIQKRATLFHYYLSLILVYGIVFLFGKQAFCNYYYLLAFLITGWMLFSKHFLFTTPHLTRSPEY